MDGETRIARQQEAIAALSQQALSGRDIAVLFDRVVRDAATVLNLNYCRIVAVAPDGTCQVRAEFDDRDDRMVPVPACETDDLFRHLMTTDEPVVLQEMVDAGLFAVPKAMLESGFQSWIEVPIRFGERFRGSLGAYSARPRGFSQDERRFLQSVANVLGMTLQRDALEADLRGHVEQLANADRRRDDFLAVLAHELRNPLAPIRHAVALLGIEGVDEGMAAEARAIIDRQVENLVRLVDDLLDVSRILRGRIELRRETVDLQSVLHRAVEASRPLIESRGHKLSVSVPAAPIPLVGDSVRLAQIVSNLLNNAAKYTGNGGEILLAAERTQHGAVIRVKDNGIGIDSSFLPHVFDVFHQAGRPIARPEDGLGMGLTLVRSLVHMHGGTITAQSEGAGKGSEFVVQLPVAQHAPGKESAAFVPKQFRPLRILVVDDHVGSALLLAKLLNRFWNHEVRVAHEGASALEIAKEFQPELVLLDLSLPGMNGFEIAGRLKQIPSLKSALLAALTGYGQDEDRDRSRDVGFDEHLVKPASVHDLERVFAHPKLA